MNELKPLGFILGYCFLHPAAGGPDFSLRSK